MGSHDKSSKKNSEGGGKGRMIKAITELVYPAFRGVDIVGFHCFHSSKGAVRETGFSRQRNGL